jgi:hypothetical protein
MANRIEPHQRQKIIRALQRKNRTYRQLSEDFSCSVSTIWRIAQDAGLSVRRTRTNPVEVPEETYDRAKRKSTLDRIYQSIDTEVSKGGLSSKQLLDLARAAREVNSARSAEDKLVDPDVVHERRRERGGGKASPLSLVDLNALGVPRDLEIYFAALDVQGAIEAGKPEEAMEAEERLKEACAAHGFKEAEIDIPAMLAKIDKDFRAHLEREEARRQARARPPKNDEVQYNGEGLA